VIQQLVLVLAASKKVAEAIAGAGAILLFFLVQLSVKSKN
jgi:hypothetical protein